MMTVLSWSRCLDNEFELRAVRLARQQGFPIPRALSHFAHLRTTSVDELEQKIADLELAVRRSRSSRLKQHPKYFALLAPQSKLVLPAPPASSGEEKGNKGKNKEGRRVREWSVSLQWTSWPCCCDQRHQVVRRDCLQGQRQPDDQEGVGT